jgi:acyl-CoA thioester hydrolase
MSSAIYTKKASYYETDQMGIVHHSNYIRYFEDARVEFMSSIGCEVSELEKMGIIIPNVDAYARYKKPIRFRDEFSVEVKPISFNGVKIVFEYEIRLTATNELAATGRTTHCIVNEELKPMSIKHSFPEMYKKLKENLED